MKIPMTCVKCFQELGHPNFNFKTFDICEENLYKMECDKGHKSYVTTSYEKFEILFSMGALALEEGYKQEAISCFASSLERFHEWFIRITLLHNNIGCDKIEKTWNLAKQTERQLGAFYFLYLKEFNEIPKQLNIKQVTFRNEVIHNGYIAKYEEAYEYGEYVWEHIKDIIIKMENHYEKDIMRYSCEKQLKLREKYKNEEISCMFCNSIINEIKQTPKMIFKDVLESIKITNNMAEQLDSIKGKDIERQVSNVKKGRE